MDDTTPPQRPFCIRCKQAFAGPDAFRAHAADCLAAWEHRKAARKKLDGYRRVVRALRLADEAKQVET
jgi:hypothetical protein